LTTPSITSYIGSEFFGDADVEREAETPEFRLACQRAIDFMPPNVPYCIIPLTQGQVVFVSPDKYVALSKINWHARFARNTRTFYAVAHGPTVNGKRSYLYMHRVIMGLDPFKEQQVDHRDAKDTLNNTDLNLRPCSRDEQARNKRLRKDNHLGLKCVQKVWHSNTYRFRIACNGTRKTYSGFNTAAEAYVAYCQKATELHGEFACFG
jgi:hypothetical protein